MIVLLLVSKNESALLRANLAHHLEWGVDHVCVADNASDDDTPDVVRSFGDAASLARFDDFGERQRVRTEMLDALRARRRVEWAGVSDTDEFWWAPGVDARELLASVPRYVHAATFEQKLFLPTEIDGEHGPVYARMLHRAESRSSPFFTSYLGGKTFYRADALRRVRHEHRNPDVATREWRHAVATVHHYMIQDEDQFVAKVRRFEAWRPRGERLVARCRRALLAAVGSRAATGPALKADFKREWWSVWEESGEAGLRAYYRERFRARRDDLARRLATGELVRDDAFAKWREAFDLRVVR